MAPVPHLPSPSHRTPSPRDPNRWIDLLAFLGVLALGSVLALVAPTTLLSVATLAVALGGLYRLWKRSDSPGDDK
jgi:hypothetical protein